MNDHHQLLPGLLSDLPAGTFQSSYLQGIIYYLDNGLPSPSDVVEAI